MKSRVILIAIATLAIVSIGASRINHSKSDTTQLSKAHTAPIGGLVAEDK